MLEDLLPAALARPVVEALPDGVPGAEALGQVAPAGTGLGDPQHGVEEQAVVFGGDPGVPRPAGQQVLDALPVLVADGVAREHGGSSAVVVAAMPIPKPYDCPHALVRNERRALQARRSRSGLVMSPPGNAPSVCRMRPST